MTMHRCDLCDGDWFHEVYHIQGIEDYLGEGQIAPRICANCGFVYVPDRRSSAEIAKDWDRIWGEGYSSKWPMVQARLYYVAEWCEQYIGSWERKSVLDLGAGEGDFAKMVMARGARLTAVEPYQANARKLASIGAEVYLGTAETYSKSPRQQFDVVTILWTLENCGDCIGLLKVARDCVKPGGHVVVATGSRILVPFKKPLSHYFSKNPQDLHSFRFSRNTLAMAMAKAGIEPVKENRWMDGDWLVMAGTVPCPKQIRIPQDDPEEVRQFFERWRREWP